MKLFVLLEKGQRLVFSIVCSAMFLFYMWKSVGQYLEKPTVTFVQTKMVKDIVFPEISICLEPYENYTALEKYGYNNTLNYYEGLYGQGWAGLNQSFSTEEVYKNVFLNRNMYDIIPLIVLTAEENKVSSQVLIDKHKAFEKVNIIGQGNCFILNLTPELSNKSISIITLIFNNSLTEKNLTAIVGATYPGQRVLSQIKSLHNTQGPPVKLHPDTFKQYSVKLSYVESLPDDPNADCEDYNKDFKYKSYDECYDIEKIKELVL